MQALRTKAFIYINLFNANFIIIINKWYFCNFVAEHSQHPSAAAAAAFMASKSMHPQFYNQTLEQQQQLLHHYRYGIPPIPNGQQIGVQRTAAVNIIQHENLKPVKSEQPTSKPEATIVDTTVKPVASPSIPTPSHMPYLPKHWIWNANLFYSATRAAGENQNGQFPQGYFAYGSPFTASSLQSLSSNYSKNNDSTSSNHSSSPIQITDVNSDDSLDNHDDHKVTI